MLGIPQPTDSKAPNYLADIYRRLDELTNHARMNNIQSSPTVRVDKTATGTTLHAAPPGTPTPPPQSEEPLWS